MRAWEFPSVRNPSKSYGWKWELLHYHFCCHITKGYPSHHRIFTVLVQHVQHATAAINEGHHIRVVLVPQARNQDSTSWVWLEMGVPQMESPCDKWFIRKRPVKMDDWGVPWGTPIYENPDILMSILSRSPIMKLPDLPLVPRPWHWMVAPRSMPSLRQSSISDLKTASENQIPIEMGTSWGT